jgi:phosphatidylglycerol---prolipoprotein diacylglyceryl transferase
VSNAFPWILTLAVVSGLAWLLLLPAGRPVGAGGSRPARDGQPQFDAGLATLAGGLIGARIGFILSHGPYFSSDALDIVRLWKGGLSGPGAFLGAACGLGLYAAAARQPVWPLGDSLAAPALWVASAAWLGCLADACAYGLPAPGSLPLPASPGILGVSLPRWPTQAVGALICLTTLILLVLRGLPGLPAGWTAAIAVLAISGGALLTSFFRGDPATMFGGVRLEALAWAVVMSLGLWTLGARWTAGRAR